MNPFDCREFVNRHPLRYLCLKFPIDFLINQARSLSNRLIEYLSQWYKIPLSPHSLEEIMKSRNIIIGEQTEPSDIDSNSWHFLAWSDPDRNLINLNIKALEKLAKSGLNSRKDVSLSSDTIRSLILAHEWFHILFDQVTKPYEWNSLKIAEQTIIEEISARIFSISVLGKSLNPFALDALICKTITS